MAYRRCIWHELKVSGTRVISVAGRPPQRYSATLRIYRPAVGTLIHRFNPATETRTWTSHVFYYALRPHTSAHKIFIVALRNNNIGTHSTDTVMPFLIIFGPKKEI